VILRKGEKGAPEGLAVGSQRVANKLATKSGSWGSCMKLGGGLNRGRARKKNIVLSGKPN